MLKKKKNYKFLIGGIVGILLSIPAVYAAASYIGTGSDLYYDNSKSGLSSTTAQDALDELYEIKNDPCPTGYICTKN
jgi:hypothetical protein